MKKGFTLAEVLITLGIIGVVAALTIPALMRKTNDRELVSSYLKTMNTLSNAVKQIEGVNEKKIDKIDTAEELELLLESNLNIISKRGNNCNYDICLSDGSGIDYEEDSFTVGCSKEVDNATNSALKNACMSLLIDSNGAKRPNETGKDVYRVWITRYGLVSEGEQNTCSGLDCGAYVLAHHQLWDGVGETVSQTSAIPEGCTDAQCTSCSDGYYLYKGNCVNISEHNTNTLATCKSSSSATCTLVGQDGADVTTTKVSTSMGDYYATPNMGITNWDNASSNCPSGTRIPSIDELEALYAQKGQPGVPITGTYWSSTERNSDYVYRLYFKDGNKDLYNKSNGLNVLCVGN